MSRLLRVILVSLLALGIAGSTAGAVRAQEALPGEEPPSAKTIALTLAPARVLADGAPHNVLYVQLRDGNRPRLAQADVAIGLTSTNPFIVQVPDAVIIPAGSSYARAAVKATDIAGDVTITAWLEGVPAARTVVTTVSPSVLSRPYYLELHPAPTTMIEGSEPAGLLSLVLVDAAGRLVPAPETIRAVLRSSEPGVVSVLEEIVIPKGKTGADTFMEPLGSGTAVLSAVAPGFSSRFVSVGVTHPALIPTQLKIQTVPPVSGLRSGPYEGVVVQALDADGMPGYFPCRDVHLVSSLPAAVDVTPLASSACGQTVQYVTATVETNERPDVATITATTTGLRPTAAEVTT